MDFRLRIPHLAFKTASPSEREAMIFEMLQRSLDVLRSKSENTEDFNTLASDVRRIESSRRSITL